MNRTLFALMYLVALASVARADAERQAPTYPFRVERSAVVGQVIEGAKGAVIYREKSLGREAAFLAAAPPAGQWPVQVLRSEPLFPIVFAAKGPAQPFYCSDRFKLVRDAPRETVCLRDRDKDGHFDEAAVGERDSGFVFEISGHYMESTGEDIAGSRVMRVRAPRAIKPVRYAIRQVRPYPDNAGLIELRYAGLQRGKPVFDVLFRTARSKSPLYAKRVIAVSARTALLHPVVGYRISRKSPPRMPAGSLEATQIVIDVVKADEAHVSAIIVGGYPAWSWYEQGCAEDAPQIVHVDEGRLPVLVRHDVAGICEKVTWVQDGKWWIVGRENASSGPLPK